MVKKRIRKKILQDENEHGVYKNLTPREFDFCTFYLKTFNPKTAAIRAGFNARGAERIGRKLLARSDILAQVLKLRQKKFEAIELSEADLIERYLEIAFSDLTDYMEFGSTTVENGVKGEKIVNFARLKDSALGAGLVSSISVDGEKVSVKMEDRLKALEWLSSFYKLNRLENAKIRAEMAKIRPECENDSGKIEIEVLRKGGDHEAKILD